MSVAIFAKVGGVGSPPRRYLSVLLPYSVPYLADSNLFYYSFQKQPRKCS